MDTMSRDPRLRAFRAADAFVVEAWSLCARSSRAEHGPLADEIRRVVARSGAALAAASDRRPGGAAERRLLRRARRHLLEGRYFLSLARRTGLIDLRGYRGLTVRQDSALREIERLIATSTPDAGAG